MRRKNKKTIIILLILFISIGFAYLSTNLFLSGTGIFSANSWDIYFDNVDEETYKTDIVSAASVSNKVTINASINLKQPKSTYTMYADIVNDGSIDAMLDSWTITNDMDTDEAKVFDINLTYADGVELTKYDLLSKESVDSIKLTVVYKDDISNSELLTADGSLNLSITLNYVQADEDVRERSTGDIVVTYNYNDTFNFANGESMDTGYFANFDKDFSIVENVYIPGDLSIRYLLIGSYDGSKVYDFNSEMFNSKYRLYVTHSPNAGIDIKRSIVNSDRNISNKIYWDADNMHVSCHIKGSTYDDSIESDYNLTGLSQRSFKIGTKDWRSASVFNPITVNFLMISGTFDNFSNYYLPTPVRSGYTFGGWYKDIELSDEIQSTDIATRNITLYAKWVAN
ncbi:MAG: InlB B-repeat-containing protein [Bacilli bacterium]|nr:InlB B-repeat-containing protein [Bacilli bacterium]